jgi:hypothetical protein
MILEDAVNEVHRKIGRNMMLFQQLEYLLKHFVANSSFSGYVSELSLIKEQRAISVRKLTLGSLVGKYLETTSTESPENSDNEPDELEDITEAFCSFKFHTQYYDAAYLDTKKDALARIVFDRNELIHHLLLKFDTKSVESCTQTGKQLDEQKEKVLSEINELKRQLDSFKTGMKFFAEFLNSDEGKRQFELSLLRQSLLALLLCEIASQNARTDGWFSLSAASLIIRREAPEEVDLLKVKYGHKSLKALILATEMFDLYEEPTAKGLRVLYRLKPDYNA